MKNIILLIIAIAGLTSCRNERGFAIAKHIPSKIDSLTTEDEIEAYIRDNDTLMGGFDVKGFSRMGILLNDKKLDSAARSYVKQLGLNKSFYKADFNNDGLTDLLALGSWGDELSPKEYAFDAMVIMNGKDKATMHLLAKTHYTVFVPEIRVTDSLPFIVLHQPEKIDNRPRMFVNGQFERAKDSAQVKLVYHSGHFVEYNSKAVKHHKIAKIAFSASPCFGTCPWFEMVLEKGKDSWFIAKHYNFDKENFSEKEEGTFKSRIVDSDIKDLEELLNYIDFENLYENYMVMHTDAPSASLIITYDDGKTKRIHDYGKSGTYGLQALYDKIANLRFNQKWEKAKEPKGVRMKQFWN